MSWSRGPARWRSSTGAVALGGAVLLGALAGCTSEEKEEPEGAPVVQLGAPGETGKTLSPEEAEELTEPAHTEADVAFVQEMIPHHEQALKMTALVPDRAEDPALAVLAERIEVSQHDEIAMFEEWLTSRGEEREGSHSGHGSGHQMPGMLTPAQLAELEEARGARFDRLFLQHMIRHHEGAVIMVESLLTDGEGGQESEIFQLASHVETDQQVEIAALKRELARISG